MRKKFTMLFASLFLLGLGTTSAEVTKFYKPVERKTTLSDGDKVMFYNTALNGDEDRTGFLVDNGGEYFGLSKQKPSATPTPIFAENVGVWTVEKAEANETYYKVHIRGSRGYVGIGGKVDTANAMDIFFHHWTKIADAKAGVNSENAAGEKVENANIADGDNVWVVANAATDITKTWNGNPETFATWETGHPYAVYSIVEAETADLEAALVTAKESAKSELSDLAKLTISTAAAAISQIEAVELENDDLETALNSIDAIVLSAKKSINGKSIVFDNNGGDGRKGLSVTAVGNNAYGTSSEGDETIWTIKSQDNGSFKLYNFVANKYLNAPGSAALTDEAGAAAYNFIVTGANQVALVSGSKMLHQATYWAPTFTLLNWYDLNDAASLWDITEKQILVSREQYDLAAAAKAALPYAVQQAYGLVTDAANYFSNYKSDAEGSYAALLDNAEGTYFHSAYGSETGDGSGVHYIQADLGEGNSVDEFYFYMKPRSGNGNNRPKEITVSGSNDINGEFTEIAKVTTTLDGSMTPYLSAKLGTDGTNYRYIRLTVTSTNTSTKFFTLSELYFFPADGDAGSLLESYHAFASSSITSSDMATAAAALVNAEATLALANIKKEVAAILAANASNHAATPVLGQYSTDAYNALNTAYTAGDATQESLEAAIAAFNKAKNLPVFTIDGVISYAAGKSVYDDQNGAPNFKATNVYDKTMWWVFDQTTETVGETESVNVVNYATRNGFWGAEALKITETSDANAEDGIFLFYTVGNNTPLHYQNDNQVIVRWDSKASDSGSATRFTHIGNTYDLDKLTDAHVTALSALQTAYNTKAFYADADLGEGLGQYKGDKAAIVATLESAEAILNVTLVELANTTVDAINAAAADINEVAGLEINLPEAGKYYRFQGACEASLPNYYITGHTNADGGRIALTTEADASTIYYFDGTNLTAYQSGLVVGLNESNWTFASYADNSKPASTIVFAGSPRQAGKYTIKSANRYFHYTVYNETVQVNRCQNDDCKEHDWTLTEVTTLPVTISAAGYATFYAPVNVELPAEVKANTLTDMGTYAKLVEENIDVIPAENGVILTGEAGTYDFAISAEAGKDLDNALEGTVAKTLVNKNEGDAYYMLVINKEGVAGLYNPVKGEDATKFYNAGHKAYWHLAGGTQSATYRIGEDEDATAIDQLLNANGELVIYDLSGRRVEKMEKGIYIVNGKKVIR